MSNNDKAFLGWTQFGDAMWLLAKTIDENDDVPDHIIGIARGGLPGSVYLSQSLKAEMHVAEATHYEGEERQEGVSINLKTIPHSLDGRVLIFDDIVDTGRTMERILDLLHELEIGDEIITASINVKPGRSVDPDYWVEQTDQWVVYPWENEL